MAVGLAFQGSSVIEVGRVTAVYWEEDARAAVRLAEVADASGPWPGIATPPQRPIRLLIAHGAARFDSLTRGRLPEWGVGAAYPASNTIILNLTRGDPLRVLRHELAHLALHEATVAVPRWFDEGYAAVAAGEWGRLAALRVNWELVRGRAPPLAVLDRRLRAGGAADADAAYALAATAVLLLQRMGGERGLDPLIAALGSSADFDQALRITHQLSLGQFEGVWHRDLRRRHGWLFFATSFSVFWAVMGTALVLLYWWRRDRDRERRAALDEGWHVAPENGDTDLDAPGTSG